MISGYTIQNVRSMHFVHIKGARLGTIRFPAIGADRWDREKIVDTGREKGDYLFATADLSDLIMMAV